MKPIQQMGYLLAANFETVIYIGAAWWGAQYLNEKFPQSFNWAFVTYVLGLLMILRSWYVVFRSLMKAQKGQDQATKETSNEKTFDRNSVVGLVFGLVVVLGVGTVWAKPLDARSLLAGYVLFALNYLAIKSISRTLVQVAANGHSSSRAKLWLSLGSLAKFLGLFGSLYLLLVVYELNGFYLAAGSLISLLILTGVQIASYLRTLAAGPATQKKL